MADKKLLQLSELGTINSGYYFYAVNGSDSSQYKVPLRVVDEYYNVAQTGSTLNTKINNYSGYASGNFATQTNLFNTGSNLQTQINSINGVNFVHVTGNETVSGIKRFNDTIRASIISGDILNRTINYGLGRITVDGKFVIDWTQQELRNASEVLVVNWNNCELYSGGLVTVDWKNRQLLNSSSEQTVNWEGSYLYSNQWGSNSLNWNSKELLNTDSSPALNWQDKELFGNWNIANNSGYYKNGGLNSLGTVITQTLSGSRVSFIDLAGPITQFKFDSNDSFYLKGNPSVAVRNCFIDLYGSLDLTLEGKPVISGFDIYANTLTISGVNAIVTGSVIRPSDTGQFYPRVGNPSGFVTGSITRPSDLTGYTPIHTTGLYDITGGRRLRFDTTSTSLYSHVNKPILVANTNGLYNYNFAGILTSAIAANSYILYNSDGGEIFNNASDDTQIGDLGVGSNGTKILITSTTDKIYLGSYFNTTKVGINNDNPQYNLDVSGTVNFTGLYINGVDSTNVQSIFSSNKLNFKTTGIHTLITVPNNKLFIIDTMEVVTTDIASASDAPAVAFGNSGNIFAYKPNAQTNSNSLYSRHIYDSPQNAVASGTQINVSIITGSTATMHSGVMYYKGFFINK